MVKNPSRMSRVNPVNLVNLSTYVSGQLSSFASVSATYITTSSWLCAVAAPGTITYLPRNSAVAERSRGAQIAFDTVYF